MADQPLDDSPAGASTPPVGRRRLLGYAGAAGAGLAGGTALGWGTAAARPTPTPPAVAPEVIRQTYSPHEAHQAGITTPTPAVTRLVAFTLGEFAVQPLSRLLKLWSSDIEALMAGRPVLGDPTPELAQAGVSLSVTVGLGPRVFELPGLAAAAPDGFLDVPPMQHDRLQARWCGGDLVVLVAADDATTVEYATRRLVRDARTFATPAWEQTGSWRGTSGGRAVTGRNLFGQVDGTGNPSGELLEATLWPTDPPAWFAGGTTLVVRRIEMDLDFWDRTTRERQEKVIGRRLADGAPLTGQVEHDALDLLAEDATGAPVIPTDAHARRSHPDENNGRRILRRGLNYTHTEVVDGVPVTTSGLVFCSFQASIARQFVPVQTRIDTLDALNDWTHAIGSAVFALPGGFAEGDWIARSLLQP
ncbi:MAG TPA: Dyp-type peroxidase [Propionicimonas sp.]|nr:Dyp-type peroxidase [Propionicimonas sp.]